jgi:mannitol-1-phosphate 5-dehydrogenase
MKAVMYGAGNIGRGFIGGTFSKSGYEVVFVDVNKQLVDRFNTDGQYPIAVVGGENTREEIIKNVRALDGNDVDAVVGEIAACDIMATSVGVNVLKHIAAPIAKGISARIAAKKPLNILLCENLADANHYFKTELFKHLSAADRARFDPYIGLVEASIGRMVPALADNGGNPLKVAVEEFDVLHLDKDGFVGEPPRLFNTVIDAPFAYYIQRKLFIHNMCHSFCAYLGYQKGYGYISEAIADPEILYAVKSAGLESAAAISRETKRDMTDLTEFADKLFYRFCNAALKDTAARVGGDPARKLGAHDRLCGSYSLCRKHRVESSFICLALASAFSYDNPTDAAAVALRAYIDANGIDAAIEHYTQGAVIERDRVFIMALYRLLKDKAKLYDIIYLCQKHKAGNIENL